MNTRMIQGLCAVLAMTVLACESGTGTTPTNGNQPQKTTATEAAAQANASVGTLSDEFGTQMAFLSESKTVDDMATGCAEGDQAMPIDPNGTDLPPVDSCGEPVDPKAMADDFQTWLKDNLLNPDFANAALSTDTETVFCMKADKMCQEDTETGTTLNEQCMQGFAAAPICIGLTKISATLMNGRLLIGKDPIVAATFTLSPSAFSAQVDLAKARQAADVVAKAHGEELPEEFPTVVEGTIGGEVAKQADGNYGVALSIVKAVRVAAFATTDKRHYDVKLGAAAKALNLTVKGAKTMIGGANFGSVDIVAAMDLLFGSAPCSQTDTPSPTPDPGGGVPIPDPVPCEEPPAKVGNFQLSIAGPAVGVTYTMSADSKVETVKLTGLSLGSDTARLKFDDFTKLTEIATLDLNKTAGRKVDVELVLGESDPIFSVVSQLDVELGHWMAMLAPQIEDLPVMFYQGVSRVLLGSAAKPSVQLIGGSDTAVSEPVDPNDPIPPDPQPAGPQAVLKVLAGTLDLTATGLKDIANVAIKVTTGQCLVEKAEDTSGGNKGEQHLFSSLEVGACE